MFRARLRQFPSLVNCCTIDWFNEWPAEALQSVASSFLSEIPLLGSGNEDISGMVGATLGNNLLPSVRCAVSLDTPRQWMQGTPSEASYPTADMCHGRIIQMQNCIAFVCLETGLAICHPCVALKPTHIPELCCDCRVWFFLSPFCSLWASHGFAFHMFSAE